MPRNIFRTGAENLMRVKDIEVMVKDFILTAYTLADGSRDEEKLAQAVLEVTPREAGSKRQKTFDQLSLYQHISVLTSKTVFFEPIFKWRVSVQGLLNDIRNIRNELAHFRKENNY
jgi:hypothetical protein